MNTKKIEKELAKKCQDEDMFFSHNSDGTGKILWLDKNENQWCVSTYRTVPRLSVDPMPDDCFTPGAI